MPDRVLRHLDEHLVAGAERELDLAGLRALVAEAVARRLPVDLAGVEDGVAAAADVDERRLHRGQHVLHAAEVDVADQGEVLALRHVVLGEDPVLEHADLDAVAGGADEHHAVDGLAAGEELGLGDDGAAAGGVAAVAAALALRLEPRRALQLLRLGDRLADRLGAGHDLGRRRRCRRRSEPEPERRRVRRRRRDRRPRPRRRRRRTRRRGSAARGALRGLRQGGRRLEQHRERRRAAAAPARRGRLDGARRRRRPRRRARSSPPTSGTITSRSPCSSASSSAPSWSASAAGTSTGTAGGGSTDSASGDLRRRRASRRPARRRSAAARRRRSAASAGTWRAAACGWAAASTFCSCSVWLSWYSTIAGALLTRLRLPPPPCSPRASAPHDAGGPGKSSNVAARRGGAPVAGQAPPRCTFQALRGSVRRPVQAFGTDER